MTNKDLSVVYRNGRWEIPLEYMGKIRIKVPEYQHIDNIVVVKTPAGEDFGITTERPKLKSAVDLNTLGRELTKDGYSLKKIEEDLFLLNNRARVPYIKPDNRATGANRISIAHPRQFNQPGILIEKLESKFIDSVNERLDSIRLHLESADKEVRIIANLILTTFNEDTIKAGSASYPSNIPKFIFNRLSHALKPFTVEELLWSFHNIKLIQRSELEKLDKLFPQLINNRSLLILGDIHPVIPKDPKEYIKNKQKRYAYKGKIIPQIVEYLHIMEGFRPLGRKIWFSDQKKIEFYLQFVEDFGKDKKQFIAELIDIERKSIRIEEVKIHIPKEVYYRPVQPTFNISPEINNFIKQYNIPPNLKIKIHGIVNKFQK